MKKAHFTLSAFLWVLCISVVPFSVGAFNIEINGDLNDLPANSSVTICVYDTQNLIKEHIDPAIWYNEGINPTIIDTAIRYGLPTSHFNHSEWLVVDSLDFIVFGNGNCNDYAETLAVAFDQDFYNYIEPELECTSYQYTDWGDCTASSTQERMVVSSVPEGCSGGVVASTTQACVYTPVPDLVATTTPLSTDSTSDILYFIYYTAIFFSFFFFSYFLINRLF